MRASSWALSSIGDTHVHFSVPIAVVIWGWVRAYQLLLLRDIAFSTASSPDLAHRVSTWGHWLPFSCFLQPLSFMAFVSADPKIASIVLAVVVQGGSPPFPQPESQLDPTHLQWQNVLKLHGHEFVLILLQYPRRYVHYPMIVVVEEAFWILSFLSFYPIPPFSAYHVITIPCRGSDTIWQLPRYQWILPFPEKNLTHSDSLLSTLTLSIQCPLQQTAVTWWNYQEATNSMVTQWLISSPPIHILPIIPNS